MDDGIDFIHLGQTFLGEFTDSLGTPFLLSKKSDLFLRQLYISIAVFSFLSMRSILVLVGKKKTHQTIECFPWGQQGLTKKEV